MRPRHVLLAALFAFLAVPFAALAQSSLYVAAMRGQAGTTHVMSGLYSVNLSNGQATFVAPLHLASGVAVALTGIAVEPTTGVFYGITSTLSPNAPQSLVTLDPATGAVTVVGPMPVTGTDIVFSPGGRLFMWLPATRQVAVVDTTTGSVSPVGTAGPPDAFGGLAMDAQGLAYVTPAGAGGTLDTVDVKTGEIRVGPRMHGAPYPGAITAMTFTPSGLLLGVNSNVGSPAAAKLVAINTLTGDVSTIGNLPDDSDAITFAPPPRDMAQILATLSGRTLALFALIAGLVLAILGMAVVAWIRRGPQKKTM